MAEPIWRIKYKGDLIELYLDDLTRHRMREIKSALGEDYGTAPQFNLKLITGDFEAIAGAIWIDGQKKGETVDMVALDFCDGDFEAAPARPKRAPGKAKPSQADTPDETSSSETPKSSETDS